MEEEQGSCLPSGKEKPNCEYSKQKWPPLQMGTPTHGPPCNPGIPEESNCTSPGGDRRGPSLQ